MDSGSIREKNNNELINLNKEYEKRKKKLIETSSEEIDQLKRMYETKEQDIRDRGNASISHIRKQAHENVTKEQEDSKKNIENTKNSLQQFTKVYEKNLAQQRTNQKERLKKVQEQFENQKNDTFSENTKKLNQIQNSQTEKLNSIQKRQRQQLYELQKQNMEEAERLQKTGRERNDTIHVAYEQQLGELHDRGNKKIINEKETNQKQMAKLKLDFKKEKTREFLTNHKAIDDQKAQFQNELENAKSVHKKEIQSRNKKYNADLANQDRVIRSSLKAQDHLYARELMKQKIDWAQKMSPFTEKSEDPFYKIIDRASQFEDREDAYVLKAFIPEYDRNNVFIRVEDDKVSVSGNRSFKDLAKDGERRLSSSQYQTFKEDFVFKQPVVSKAAIQSRDGDFVTVTIPKISRYYEDDKLT